jgi:hypothetical protein
MRKKRLKDEKYKGHTVSFERKHKYISKDFPASPYVIVYVDGTEIGRDHSKERAFQLAKIRIDRRRR